MFLLEIVHFWYKIYCSNLKMLFWGKKLLLLFLYRIYWHCYMKLLFWVQNYFCFLKLLFWVQKLLLLFETAILGTNITSVI